MGPGLTVSDAKKAVNELIEEENAKTLRARGLFLRLQVYMGTSWLELNLLKECEMSLV